ncbi:hypothetical protein EDC01DRAFT_776975 [Geopyxis carbonaria]|nr:hypothetical protein EDC01DRAFT_776975 [Geopyxis carbonaria]
MAPTPTTVLSFVGPIATTTTPLAPPRPAVSPRLAPLMKTLSKALTLRYHAILQARLLHVLNSPPTANPAPDTADWTFLQFSTVAWNYLRFCEHMVEETEHWQVERRELWVERAEEARVVLDAFGSGPVARPGVELLMRLSGLERSDSATHFDIDDEKFGASIASFHKQPLN